ncbi:MFS transporter [Caulobacter sp. Root655]|uniref:MFS transporter n=1 Tax=Caulobacter sp. Root655 TaxID=1736578 RepID=UPI0006F71975|nr:MFS transporter [Caulobacter sp. Root655]KRA59885.1 MFS transporter [Caulobacter sp. Root655]
MTAIRPWLLVAAFSLLLFLITAATYSSLGVVIPAMVPELGWSWEHAFLGFSILGVFTGLSSWLPALLIRRIGVRGTVLVGVAVMAGGLACLSRVHALPIYFLGTALCGVGFQMAALIPGTHVLSAIFKQRALPFGIYFTFGALGGVAGPWMVVSILGATHDDWRLYWALQAVLVGLVGLVCAVAVGGPRWLEQAGAALDKVLDDEARAQHASGVVPGKVYHTDHEWSVRDAVRTPQFYVLLAAYFSHLLAGISAASLTQAHLTQLGVAGAVAAGMLSLEGLMQVVARLGGGAIGDRVDPRWLLVFAQGLLVIGLLALARADSTPLLVLYAVGVGVGFGLTVLAVSLLLLNYFGRRNNVELFSLTCLIGAVSAAGPFIGGFMRDRLGTFTPTFQLFAAVTAVVFVAALFMRPPTARAQA